MGTAFSFPIWTAILAYVFLGERLARIQILGALVMACALVLFIKPGSMFKEHHSESPKSVHVGFVLAISSALSFSAQSVIVKHTGSTNHWLTVEFVTGFVCCVGVVPVYVIVAALDPKQSPGVGVPNPKSDVALLFLLGTMAFGALGLVTSGMQKAPAFAAAVVMCLELPITFVIQLAAFDSKPTPLDWVGMVMVCLTCATLSISSIASSSTRNGDDTNDEAAHTYSVEDGKDDGNHEDEGNDRGDTRDSERVNFMEIPSSVVPVSERSSSNNDSNNDIGMEEIEMKSLVAGS
uniref:EamA domain-containing protein n=1 Tax=Lotharella globosa TaxID=91324 RepID=A0A7S3YQ08_9EUKA|mmetsp:Transcript_12704/g.25931  ORF Transcript_12704/g.25931 Transcript_12704/m.25931 type:complete len:293 (-) Transcript_12704:132-1010(-)